MSLNLDSVARRYVEHDTLPQETFGILEVGLDLGAPEGDRIAYWSPPANDNLRQVAPTAATERKRDWNEGLPRRGDFMQTYSARQFWPLDARPEEVHIEDIAHSLSLQCRYAGHCKRFYSVAEHSVLIANWIWWHGSASDALCGLLHDATEAYLVDMPRPVKRSMHEYRLHEAALWRVIAGRYGLPEVMPAIVHEADNRIIADELVNMAPMAWHTKHDDPLDVELQFWTPEQAEAAFLETFVRLKERVAGAKKQWSKRGNLWRHQVAMAKAASGLDLRGIGIGGLRRPVCSRHGCWGLRRCAGSIQRLPR
ncbi:hypothetical protein LB533_20200 [Mesorhizobium sp. BR1-1-13]|uniref:hypothetical protein n=1 Tax=Mesorhizobium sp. BR1-1-13 TaxID=2876656 RepID=UPI001CD051BF|nr:hypothetical protein [Mesorhizobium sp. BR1-1-13]MBZ9943411.1 hypothetical protein [Mesorhizobium sp. BR1-1-13]